MTGEKKEREEYGTVVEKKGKRAFIRVYPASPGGCEGCGMCALVESGDRVMEVEAGDLRPGDRVIVRPRRCSSYTSIMLLLAAPVMLFMAGLGAGSWVWPGSDLLPVLLGGAGLVAGFAGAWRVEKHLEGRQTVEVGRAKERSGHKTEKGPSGCHAAIARCCDAAAAARDRR